MMDILFRTDEYVFSYRVAGICVHNGHLLLQKPVNDRAYAIPGGHVALGETNAQSLIREFREEIGAEISVGELKWVSENFFPWGDKRCHQICLYYMVNILDDRTPRTGKFRGVEERMYPLEFSWVKIDRLDTLQVYPVEAPELMKKLEEGVQHFVYQE